MGRGIVQGIGKAAAAAAGVAAAVWTLSLIGERPSAVPESAKTAMIAIELPPSTAWGEVTLDLGKTKIVEGWGPGRPAHEVAVRLAERLWKEWSPAGMGRDDRLPDDLREGILPNSDPRVRHARGRLMFSSELGGGIRMMDLTQPLRESESLKAVLTDDWSSALTAQLLVRARRLELRAEMSGRPTARSSRMVEVIL
ncbi:MAG: hypothetical protein MH204_08325 [Fimbriimonadaceae bacterium]|nr:hypothetical protein [Fimbriimonadaceae bacterium]